jgi:hypothetical protein
MYPVPESYIMYLSDFCRFLLPMYLWVGEEGAGEWFGGGGGVAGQLPHTQHTQGAVKFSLHRDHTSCVRGG